MVESALIPAGPPELEAERDFLTEARAALARMHRVVAEREVPLIGGEDNDERFTNESNIRAHRLRTQALIDLLVGADQRQLRARAGFLDIRK